MRWEPTPQLLPLCLTEREITNSWIFWAKITHHNLIYINRHWRSVRCEYVLSLGGVRYASVRTLYFIEEERKCLFSNFLLSRKELRSQLLCIFHPIYSFSTGDGKFALIYVSPEFWIWSQVLILDKSPSPLWTVWSFHLKFKINDYVVVWCPWSRCFPFWSCLAYIKLSWGRLDLKTSYKILIHVSLQRWS